MTCVFYYSDALIEQLQNEKLRLREKIQHIMMEHQKLTEELRDKVAELETDLATRDSELLQERQLKEDLLRHTEEASKYHEFESNTLITSHFSWKKLFTLENLSLFI